MTSYTRTKELLLVPPALEPVSINDVMAHLRLDSTSDNAYLATLITAARQTIEAECWCSLNTQTWQYWWDRFEWQMYIPRPPLISSTFIQYLAPQSSNSVYTVCPTSIYELSQHRGIPLYRLQCLQTWPITRGYRDDVMCQVVTGYGPNPTDVPGPIRQAILLLVAHMYLNRGEVVAQLPPAIGALMGNYRFKEF